MLGAVAPLLPAAGEAAIALTLLLACLVSLGLLWGYRATLKQLFGILAATFDKVGFSVLHVSFYPLRPLATALRWVAGQIDYLLATFVTATQGGVVYFWNLLTGQLTALANLLGSLAETVEHALARTERVVIPQHITNITRTTIQRIGLSRAAAQRIAARSIATVEHDIAGVRGDLNALRELGIRLGRRIAKLERTSLTGVATGAVVLALSKVGMGWLRCRNVNKAGRGVCRMDTGLLDSLLADSLIFFGTFSLVEFARELQGLEADAAKAIRTLTRAG